MKVEVGERGDLVLKEVFNGIVLETAEGHRLGVCMRDDTFEISVIHKTDQAGRWHVVDLENRTIVLMGATE